MPGQISSCLEMGTPCRKAGHPPQLRNELANVAPAGRR
nr:MAG TPA: hypothetical protein [Caudoviricetes sp.]